VDDLVVDEVEVDEDDEVVAQVLVKTYLLML
jgi:hypothetical protein